MTPPSIESDDRLGEELPLDVARARADGFADADLARALASPTISMMFMITMPPTTMPMATTAGMTQKSTAVRFFQNATSASAVSTEKSFSWPGRSRCAMRIASSARAMPAATSPASRHLHRDRRRAAAAVEHLVARERNERDRVERLARARGPCDAITPMTSNRSPAIRTSSPTGSVASNSFSATSAPSTTTARRCVSSTSVSGRPRCEAVVLHVLIRRGDAADRARRRRRGRATGRRRAASESRTSARPPRRRAAAARTTSKSARVIIGRRDEPLATPRRRRSRSGSACAAPGTRSCRSASRRRSPSRTRSSPG